MNKLTIALIVGFCLVVAVMLIPNLGRLWERLVLWFKSQ
jgi:hypothetical protein